MKKPHLPYKIILLLAGLLLLCGCGQKVDYSENFWTQSERIRDAFAYPGYTEVMGDESHILLVPEKYELVGMNDNYLFDQKLFVYKNPEKNTVFLLQMTVAPEAEDRWRSSLNYEPGLFNAEDSRYGSSILADLPNVDVTVMTFAHAHVNYCVLFLGPAGEEIDFLTEAVDFCNCLLDFLGASPA